MKSQSSDRKGGRGHWFCARDCVRDRWVSGPMAVWAMIPVMLLLIVFPTRAQVTTVETAGANRMDGFEFYNGGLFWWNTGYLGNEVTPPQIGRIDTKYFLVSDLNRRSSASVSQVQGTAVWAPYQSAARTDSYLFHFQYANGGLRLYRLNLISNPASDQDFTGLGYDSGGAVALVDQQAFFGVVRGSTTQLRSKPIDAAAGGGDVIEVSLGNVGPIIKMGWIDVVDVDEGRPYERQLIFLTAYGALYTYKIFPYHENLSQIANDVTDFAIRQESRLVVLSPFDTRKVFSSVIYATTGKNLSSTRLSGRLVSFDLSGGSTRTVYDTRDINLQLTAVTVDDARLFLTRTPLVFQGGPFFGGFVYELANSQILRRVSPAQLGTRVFPYEFESIVLQQEGRNLRSNGDYLYFAHQNLIRRVQTQAAGVLLDLGVVSLEVGQTIQNGDNGIPIVGGAPVVARVYARTFQNTTGKYNWRAKARIRGFRNGQPLDPPEVWSWNQPVLSSETDLARIRGNSEGSIRAELPATWFNQPGLISIEATVNPTLSTPETGNTPLANNSTSQSVSVVSGGTPCLVFNVVSTTLGNYDPTAANSGLQAIMDRAQSLLPVPGFRYSIRAGTINKGSSAFDMPTDQNAALMAVGAAHALERNPGGCLDTHWVGMFPSGTPGFNGLGESSGGNLLIRMSQEQTVATLPWTTTRGGFALAHELGHNYGREHIDQSLSKMGCNTNPPLGPWDSYLFDPCTLGLTDLANRISPIGYDYLSDSFICPQQAGDLMSYAGLRWTSVQTLLRLQGDIPGPIAAVGAYRRRWISLADPDPPVGSVVFIQAYVDAEALAATILPLVQGERTTFDEATVSESLAAAAKLPSDAPWRLRLLDGHGITLLETPALLRRLSESPETKLLLEQFILSDPSASTLEIVHGDALIAKLSASANAPVIALGTPVLDADNHALNMNWTAVDLDGDVVLTTIQFSPDDGATWQTLAVRETKLGLSVSTDLLPGGEKCRLRVLASDGFRTSIATTDPFVVPKHGPRVTVDGVRGSQRVPFGQPIEVRAFAYDAEDGGLGSSSTSWSLKGTEERSGKGPHFIFRDLAPGNYLLQVSAVDSEGNEGLSAISFEVLPILVQSGAPPSLDGLCTDPLYQTAPVVSIRPGTPEPTAHLARSSGYLYVCLEGVPLATDGAPAVEAHVLVDADRSKDPAPQPGDRLFGVTEDGILIQRHGDGSAMVDDALRSPGFAAQIVRSESTWSAELQIPESLLSGTDQGSGVALFFGNSAASTLWPPLADPARPNTWAAAQIGSLPALPNRAPFAVASGPSVVSLTSPQNIELDGSGSYDPDGDAISYTWRQVDGPSVDLQNADGVKASFKTPNLDVPAVLRFRLTVTDGTLESSPTEVVVDFVPAPTPSHDPGISMGTVSVGNGEITGRLPWPGADGDLVVIQASTNLVDWLAIATNTVGYLKTTFFEDLAAKDFPYRFYRAVAFNPNRTLVGGTALAFDGSGVRVDIAHDPALNAFPLTLMAWVKTGQDTGAYPGIVTKYNGESELGYAIGLDHGRLTAWYYANGTHLWDSGEGSDGRFIANGQWHHVAYVVDETGGRIYLNGTLVNSHAWTGPPASVTVGEALRFGAYLGGTGLPWAGQLDEVSIWSRVLSAGEIRNFQHHPLQGTEAGLVGYWKMDDATGTTVTNSTGPGLNGTWIGEPDWVPSLAPIYP